MEIDQKIAALRRIPAVDELLRREAFVPLLSRFSRSLVLRGINVVLAAIREKLRANGARDAVEPCGAELDENGRISVSVRSVEEAIDALTRPSLVRAINATGVVLHTNLGRAPLAPRAAEHGAAIASGYSTLEFDVGARRRGSRQNHVASLLAELSGAEAALATNNNAAAVLLALAAIAAGREVIVSRGELVEIGGSFRIPDVMRASGARLVEVGTTNRTRADDYARAITEDTAILLKVHRSNFAIVGFACETSVAELASVARPRGLPVAVDLGSGSLVDLAACDLRGEPTIQATIAAGADLVTASGDKLLGGPQTGLIVGRRDLVEACKRHPIARAVRCDKFTIAALESTLRAYRDGDPWREIPTLAALSTPANVLEGRAHALAASLEALAIPGLSVRVRGASSRVGGGAFPAARLKSWVVELTHARLSARQIEARMRAASPPVVARIARGAVLIDPRTLAPTDEQPLLTAVAGLLDDGREARA